MSERCAPIGTASRSAPIHILLVEDDATDAMLVARSLRPRTGVSPFALARAETLRDGLARLASSSPDALLLDLNLPDSRSVDTLMRVRERDTAVPIVVFTAGGDERTARAALEAGAQDYLVKDEISASLLARAIHHAIERRRLQSERERAQKERLESRRLESLGRFAAEIGHDFHNLLSVIAMNAEAVRGALSPNGSAWASLEAIRVAAECASGLARQLRQASFSGPLAMTGWPDRGPGPLHPLLAEVWNARDDSDPVDRGRSGRSAPRKTGAH